MVILWKAYGVQVAPVEVKQHAPLHHGQLQCLNRTFMRVHLFLSHYILNQQFRNFQGKGIVMNEKVGCLGSMEIKKEREKRMQLL